MYFIQHCFIYRPSDYVVSEDAGIDPGTVVQLAVYEIDYTTVHIVVQVKARFKFFLSGLFTLKE
jgi:hypothetical protein